MKKILVVFLLIVSGFYLKSNAEVIIDYSSGTIVQEQQVERNLLIKASEKGVYDILIRPLDDALTSSDGTVRIPLDNVYINNFHEDVYIRYNETSRLFNRLDMNDLTKTAIAKIRDYGMVPAGTYNLNFEVLAVNSDTQVTTSVNTFNLQFIVPVIQDINFEAKHPTITVGIDDVLETDKEFKSDIAPMVYITSNTDWVLLVKNESLETKAGDYYIRTVSASDKVTERLQERVRLDYGQEVVIARGKSPSHNEYVSIEYSVERNDHQKLQPGEYKNDIKFILRENGRI